MNPHRIERLRAGLRFEESIRRAKTEVQGYQPCIASTTSSMGGKLHDANHRRHRRHHTDASEQ